MYKPRRIMENNKAFEGIFSSSTTRILRLERYIPRLHHPFISRPVLVLIARIPTTSDPVARMHATRLIATRLEGDRNRIDFCIFLVSSGSR